MRSVKTWECAECMTRATEVRIVAEVGFIQLRSRHSVGLIKLDDALQRAGRNTKWARKELGGSQLALLTHHHSHHDWNVSRKQPTSYDSLLLHYPYRRQYARSLPSRAVVYSTSSHQPDKQHCSFFMFLRPAILAKVTSPPSLNLRSCTCPASCPAGAPCFCFRPHRPRHL